MYFCMVMTSAPQPTAPKPLRADAQRNYDQLVGAAEAAFTEQGAAACLEDIAKRANVGIGTLYRHFPTREDLIAKILDKSTLAVIASARQRLTAPEPAAQLEAWIAELVESVTTYRGLTGALAAGYVSQTGSQLCSSCDAMTAAGDALLKRAQVAGEIRPEAEIREVILSAHSVAWIAEQTRDPAATARLLRIFFDGLRAVEAAKPPPEPVLVADATTAARAPAPRAPRRAAPKKQKKKAPARR